MIYSAPWGLCSQPVIDIWLDWRGDWQAQAPVVWSCGWLLAGWVEYCTHCWCCLPLCQCRPSCHFDLEVCCLGSSPISCAWDWGWVWKMGAQLECWQLGYPIWEEPQAECCLTAPGCSWMLGQWWSQVLEWWWQWVLHSLSMWNQHWTWQWQRETMEEASPNWPDSSERVHPWRWCPSSQPFWSIGPLVSEPSWIAGPHNSWSTLPVWGPASIQADPWSG